MSTEFLAHTGIFIKDLQILNKVISDILNMSISYYQHREATLTTLGLDRNFADAEPALGYSGNLAEAIDKVAAAIGAGTPIYLDSECGALYKGLEQLLARVGEAAGCAQTKASSVDVAEEKNLNER